jgi:peptidoglycan/LPS O-acetylase OafA/YrhL
MGVLAAMIVREKRNIKNLRYAIPVLGLGTLAFTIFTPTPDNPMMQSFGYTWVAAFYATVLLYAVTQESIVSRAMRTKWLGWVGGIAYGVYLIHQTIQSLVFGIVWHSEPSIHSIGSLLTTLVALVLTFVIAHLSFRYFEKPLLNTKMNLHFARPSLETAAA